MKVCIGFHKLLAQLNGKMKLQQKSFFQIQEDYHFYLDQMQRSIHQTIN